MHRAGVNQAELGSSGSRRWSRIHAVGQRARIRVDRHTLLIGRLSQGDVGLRIVGRVDLDFVQRKRTTARNLQPDITGRDRLVLQGHHQRLAFADSVERFAVMPIDGFPLRLVPCRAVIHQDFEIPRAGCRAPIRPIENDQTIQAKRPSQIHLPPGIRLAAGRMESPAAVLDSVTAAGGILCRRHALTRRGSGKLLGSKCGVAGGPVGLQGFADQFPDVRRTRSFPESGAGAGHQY